MILLIIGYLIAVAALSLLCTYTEDKVGTFVTFVFVAVPGTFVLTLSLCYVLTHIIKVAGFND
jgi:hypothetical protein